MLTDIPTVNEVLECHAPALGRDVVAYRNHRQLDYGRPLANG